MRVTLTISMAVEMEGIDDEDGIEAKLNESWHKRDFGPTELAETFDDLLRGAGIEREKDDYGCLLPETEIDERLDIA